MPILECILIDATTDIIKFTANDMELGIETVVNGLITSAGSVALNAKIFPIDREMPADMMEKLENYFLYGKKKPTADKK